MRWISLLIVLSGVSAKAADSKPLPPTFTHDTSQCMFGTHRLEIQFASESPEPGAKKGQPYVWIKPEGVSPILAIRSVGEKSSRFELLGKGSPDSSCDRTLTYRFPRGLSAILLKQRAHSDQPDSLAVIVWQAETKKIVAVKRDLGAFQEIETSDKGFRFSQDLRPYQPKTYKVQLLKQDREVEESQMRVWYRVTINNGKVDSSFSRKQTYEASLYKKYFSTQKSFEKAFEWDNEAGIYARRWVFLAKSTGDNQPDCIQPASKRQFKPEEKYWYCEPTED